MGLTSSVVLSVRLFRANVASSCLYTFDMLTAYARASSWTERKPTAALEVHRDWVTLQNPHLTGS